MLDDKMGSQEQKLETEHGGWKTRQSHWYPSSLWESDGFARSLSAAVLPMEGASVNVQDACQCHDPGHRLPESLALRER